MEGVTNYSPVGNIIVVSICFVVIILLAFSYIRRSLSFRIFLSLVFFLILSALTDVVSYSLATSGNPSLLAYAYSLRCVYHMLLFAIFLGFVLYICETARLELKQRMPFLLVALLIFFAVVSVDVLSTTIELSESEPQNLSALDSRNIFVYGYIAFLVLIVALIIRVRDRLYRRVMLGFYGTMAVSLVVLLIQSIFEDSSFTVATFLYPILAMFYIMHATPYDAVLGAVDRSTMDDMVRFCREKGLKFIFMSLYLRQFDEDGKIMPPELQAATRRFSANYFRSALLTQVGNGHMLLIFRTDRNPYFEVQIQRMLSAFQEEYEKFHFDYKIVIGESIDEISEKNEYVSLLRSIHRGMAENTILRVNQEHVAHFKRTEIIMRQLRDIHDRADLDDPRVLAYCQPVFNIRTLCYDTAEALMRLELEELGIVMPSEFIPLAEENGCIHVLTEIILSKTCAAIKKLIDEGYSISRISVNVSALELKEDCFCEDITGIIRRSGIPGDRIAIELTESQTDSDFLLMKSKIGELRELGIKFYLDDFGTGYSNMERILELPFDIIKFDRSMVLASGSSERSRQVVISLANMFASLDYSVLYEGVESETDEKMCKDMAASYLQGFKYSYPVPIDALNQYMMK